MMYGLGPHRATEEGGGDHVSLTEQVLSPGLEASMPPFVIQFQSFNKIKQPEKKCSCWLFKSIKQN